MSDIIFSLTFKSKQKNKNFKKIPPKKKLRTYFSKFKNYLILTELNT